MASKYTVYGSALIDRKIESDMELIKKRLLERLTPGRVEALVLGGGYGRGEGGAVLKGESESLFNDYDLFVITPDLPRRLLRGINRELSRLSEELSRELSFEVDLSRAIPRSRLRRLPFNLMNYELKAGHRVIYGDGHILESIPPFKGSELALVEALKLLLNRGVGLVLSLMRLEREKFGENDSEFVRRNLEKAVMAAGDALLIERGLFSASYRQRLATFESAGVDEELSGGYREAILYKLRPQMERGEREELRSRIDRFLPRYKKIYSSILSSCSGLDEAELPRLLGKRVIEQSGRGKNILLNLRYPGPALPWIFRYPRERLYYLLYLFLFGEELPLREIERALSMRGASYLEQRERFIKIWERYN